MQIPMSEAKGRLIELVRRAEVGDEIILTRHGHAAVRLVQVKAPTDRKFLRQMLEAIRAAAAAKASPGRLRPAARTFSTVMKACPDDRHRYLGDHGRRSQRTGGQCLHRRD